MIGSVVEGLFGRPGRVLLRPGTRLDEAILKAHARQHPESAVDTAAGETANFTFFVRGSGPEEGAATQAMLTGAEADYAALSACFGGIIPPGLPFRVYADAQAVGAYHMSCTGTDIHVLPDPVRSPGLLTAIVVDVFEAAINNGWHCGQTNGEALSRGLAFDRYPNLAADFTQSGELWWANGHHDYVNYNGATDTNEPATGCGSLFLHYLHAQLSFSWNAICLSGGPTLGATYQKLAGYPGPQGFNDFVTLLGKRAKDTQLSLPSSGNPFPI